jgi:hypothetical protein
MNAMQTVTIPRWIAVVYGLCGVAGLSLLSGSVWRPGCLLLCRDCVENEAALA